MGVVSRETLQRLWLLYLIESFDRGVYGSTRLQKVAYFAAKGAPARPLTFISYEHGQYSEEVPLIVEQLASMDYVHALQLDTGDHGNQYRPTQPGMRELHGRLLSAFAPAFREAVDASIAEYGYLQEAVLLKKAKSDPLYLKTEYCKPIFEADLADSLEVDLPQSDCEDLELAMNPRFVTSMAGLIKGIDSGAIQLEQWREIG